MLYEGSLAVHLEREMRHNRLKASLDENCWRYYGPETKPYEESFAPFLEQLGSETIIDVLQSRYESTGEPQSVLDLMAPASSFIEQISDKSCIGVTSAVSYKPRQGAETMATEQQLEQNIYPFYGDILGRKVWRKLNRLCDEKDMSGFDLIMCRPFGPFKENMYFSPFVFAHSLNSAYNILSPHNGILLTQLPPIPQDQPVFDWDSFTNWKNSLKQFDIESSINIRVKSFLVDADFMMIRGQKSPDRLPALQHESVVTYDY